ncbi:MAG: DUF3108 domain-containing protein [Candidatus Hydrogenedentota bacterium]|nr:MAG: DUF3108 domain-containing protein [Candidatus Hydrogenedentota bacterium]
MNGKTKARERISAIGRGVAFLLFGTLLLTVEIPEVRGQTTVSKEGEVDKAGGGDTLVYPVRTNTAWRAGEELTYELRFLFFKAGTGVFRVEDGPERNGRPTYRIVSTLKSRPGFMYGVDDRNVSIVDREGLFTYEYRKRQREGRYRNNEVTTFDHYKELAYRVDDGVKHKPMHFDRFSADVLSVIYLIRTLPIENVGRTVFPVHDGRRDYSMTLRVKRHETVRTPYGKFRCLVVKPYMVNKERGPLKKGSMELWLTDDARRIPVKIKISVGFGSIEGRLVKMTGVS